MSGAQKGHFEPIFEWHITVLRRNHYGDRVEARTPMVVLAADRDELTAKVRAAFGATYDGFRKFWSHGWELSEVREVRTDPCCSVCAEIGGPHGVPDGVQ